MTPTAESHARPATANGHIVGADKRSHDVGAVMYGIEVGLIFSHPRARASRPRFPEAVLDDFALPQ